MQEEKIKIENSEEIANIWDKFMKVYQNRIEMNLLNFYFNILSLCKINEAKEEDNVLELGLGTGLGFSNLKNLSKAKIYGGDISPEMVKEAQRINPNHEISVINNEDLSKFKDNFFRNVFSNYSLHIVENPVNMLKEVKRVLRKDSESKAVFTVWGRPENNPLFTIIPTVLKECNINLPKVRSPFHLCSKEVMKKICLEAGFENILMEYTTIILNYFNINDFMFMLDEHPHYKETFKNMDEKLVEEIRNKVKNLFNYEIEKRGGLLPFEGLIVILN